MILAGSAGVSSAQVAPYIIDDFRAPTTQTESLKTDTSFSVTATHQPLVNTMGGKRVVTVDDNFSMPSRSNAVFLYNSFVSSFSGRSLYSAINMNALSENSDIDVTYAYGDPGGTSVDFSPYSKIEFLWEGDHASYGNTTSVKLTLTDSSNNTFAVTNTWSYIAAHTLLDTEWNLVDFENAGVDTSSIEQVELKVNTDREFDGGLYMLKAVATPVPEPSATVLFGLGGLALILRRRK